MGNDQAQETGAPPPGPPQPPAAPPDGRIRLAQDTETPLTTFSMPVGTALYLYARSGDSVDAETIGQDYVTFRYGEHDLAFAVCDGVGQSFMGDLAARLLGDGLIDWLWSLDAQPESAEAFAEAVTGALNALTAAGAAQAVLDFRLPGSLPPLVVAALEMQRKYGSESMFVAGRLALGGADPWAALCWLGDSPVAAIDIDGELVDLGPRGRTAERWNAASGVRGQVHTWVSSAERIARVAGYTDGLGVEHVPTDADLARLMAGWLENPPGDDASLFDVRLAPSPETTGPSDPAELKDLKELAFQPDLSRPIVVEQPRTPVKDVQPIEAAPPESAAVESWRPLEGKKEASSEPTLPPIPATLPEAAEMLSTMATQALAGRSAAAPPSAATQQQIQMWQQAALLGLTSAALAMLMVERLIKGEESKEG